MKIRNIVRIIVYLIAIIIPILAMLNCSGWSTRNMEVDQCIVDTAFLRELSNNSYNALFFSCYMFGLPIALYAIIVVSLTELPIYISTKVKNINNIPSPNKRSGKKAIIFFVLMLLSVLLIVGIFH